MKYSQILLQIMNGNHSLGTFGPTYNKYLNCQIMMKLSILSH